MPDIIIKSRVGDPNVHRSYATIKALFAWICELDIEVPYDAASDAGRVTDCITESVRRRMLTEEHVSLCGAHGCAESCMLSMVW